MPHVPTSIKVVSILAIIYAGIMLLMMPCSVFLMVHPLTPNPMLDALNRDPVYMTFYWIAVPVSLALFTLLLAGAIASLKLRPWGRKSMLLYAGVQLLVAVVNTIASLILIAPKMQEAIAADPRIAPMADLMKVSSIVGGVLGLLFHGGVSAVIIYFFNRKVAVDAFHGIFPADPTHFPVVYADPAAPGGTPPPLP